MRRAGRIRMTDGAAPASPWRQSRRGRPRDPDFGAKREAVLAAAAALMARHGYEGMSLAELAGMLNVSKPTLYHYVGSKEALFAELVERSQRATIDFIAAVAAGEGTGLEKLRRILVGYAEIVNSDPGTSLIFSRSASVSPDVGRQIVARSREANAIIRRVLREGEADGTLRIVDPSIVLQTLFGAVNWTPNWFRPGGRLSLRELAELQADILLAGVRGPAA
jgi:AcrR family transcriptional regulator